jgi:hypothetical protein
MCRSDIDPQGSSSPGTGCECDNFLSYPSALQLFLRFILNHGLEDRRTSIGPIVSARPLAVLFRQASNRMRVVGSSFRIGSWKDCVYCMSFIAVVWWGSVWYGTLGAKRRSSTEVVSLLFKYSYQLPVPGWRSREAKLTCVDWVEWSRSYTVLSFLPIDSIVIHIPPHHYIDYINRTHKTHSIWPSVCLPFSKMTRADLQEPNSKTLPISVYSPNSPTRTSPLSSTKDARWPLATA